MALCATALVACTGPEGAGDASGPARGPTTASDADRERATVDLVGTLAGLPAVTGVRDRTVDGGLRTVAALARRTGDEAACAPVRAYLEDFPADVLAPETSSVEVRDRSDVPWRFRAEVAAGEPGVVEAYCVASRAALGVPRARSVAVSLGADDPLRPLVLVRFRPGTVRSQSEGQRLAQEAVPTYDEFRWAFQAGCDDLTCR